MDGGLPGVPPNKKEPGAKARLFIELGDLFSLTFDRYIYPFLGCRISPLSVKLDSSGDKVVKG